MKKFLTDLVVILVVLFSMSACGPKSPDKIFSIAVLNTNLLSGFAGSGFERQLESTSAVMNEGSTEPAAMKSVDQLNQKILFVEESYGKVEALPVNDDDRQMIESSLAVYRFVIPVMKNDYMKLAQMYDNKAPESDITAMKNEIRDKYSGEYKVLYDKMIGYGKEYASKHNIKVNWN